MTKHVTLSLLVVALLAADSGLAQTPAGNPATIGDLTVSGSQRSRVESWNWFEADSGSEYDIPGSTLRVALARSTKSYDWSPELALPINDLWYSGGGVFQPNTFGYTGRPANGHAGLATLYDISADYNAGRHVGIGTYYTSPDAGPWRDTVAVNIHMMPLWWRTDRPEEITVRALHDGKSLALMLKWEDATHDETAIRPQDFRDAAAVEFAMAPDPPFFAMGQAGQPVNIWMWKSERQADLQPAFQDLEKVYPNIGIDSYPNLLKSPLEQPMRNALTLESDPWFVTAWGAGNIVADPTRHSAAEDLSAQGFGTLGAHPPAAQAVTASGEFTTGSYLVQFTRAFAAGQNAIRLSPGMRVPVAFAVWNGSAGDRDGKKSVTIWQELVLEK